MDFLILCRVHFNFELPSNMLIGRYKQFLDNPAAKTDLLSVRCFYYYLATNLRLVKFL